jgi:DNA repair photolyase
MGLNVAKGNMYDFVTHTWNAIKGKCPHDCSYCYMKRWGNLSETHIDRRELKTNLGEGNFIFVGSSCDMFAGSLLCGWTDATLDHCRKFNNKYLFQSKNPGTIRNVSLPDNSVICTTIETNRFYPDIMRESPRPEHRASAMNNLSHLKRYVTIEPIIDFDLLALVDLIKQCEPEQVNIGADSGNNGLPEPDARKVLDLIDALSKFTTIARKTNLGRLMNAP